MRPAYAGSSNSKQSGEMDPVSFTIVDFLVLGVVGVSAVYAMYKGLLQEMLSIFAWVAAAFSTLYFAPVFKPVLRNNIEAEWLADAIAYVGVFLIVLIPLSFISFRFSESVRRSDVGPIDRTFGFVFGIGRGLVLLAIAYLVFAVFVPIREHPNWVRNAQSLELIQATSEIVLDLVPEERDVATGRTARTPRAQPAAKPTKTADSGKKADKTYGADDRRALDRLIEATGD